MILNKQNIKDIFNGFKTAYKFKFEEVEKTYPLIAMYVKSTAKVENYKWIGRMASMRKWLGDRVVNNIEGFSYFIENEKFELTNGLPREDVEDDTWGLLTPVVEDMAETAATHPDELCWQALLDGFETECYDGQNLFDTDHKVTDKNGNEYSVSNMQAGSSAPWFLVDDSRKMKPIIFQERSPAEFTALTALTDENVFMKDQYLFGIRARYAAKPGLWQLAFGSKAELTEANFTAAYEAMTGMKGDQGRPIKVKPRKLIVGASNHTKALEIMKALEDKYGKENGKQRMLEVVVSDWLD